MTSQIQVSRRLLLSSETGLPADKDTPVQGVVMGRSDLPQGGRNSHGSV